MSYIKLNSGNELLQEKCNYQEKRETETKDFPQCYEKKRIEKVKNAKKDK
jgi:hypothetical protein